MQQILSSITNKYLIISVCGHDEDSIIRLEWYFDNIISDKCDLENSCARLCVSFGGM